MATIELNKAAKQAGADHPNVPIGAKFKSNHKYAKGEYLILVAIPQYPGSTGKMVRTAGLMLINNGKIWGDAVYPRESSSWDVAPHVKWVDMAADIKKYELEQLPVGTTFGVIA